MDFNELKTQIVNERQQHRDNMLRAEGALILLEKLIPMLEKEANEGKKVKQDAEKIS